jgi:outer membrane protein OmpA-like peptidoglycan-associated protein
MKEPTTGGIGGMDNNGEPPTEKMLDAAIAIREAFNSPINLDSLDPRDAPLIKRIHSRLIQGDTVDPGPEGRNHDNQSVRPGDFTTVGGTIDFDDNSSDLAPSAVTQVADLREHLAGHRWIIEVRGHVSAAEARRDEQKARRLSFERAWAVARVLAEQGIEWRQIRIVACGDSEPLRPRPHERGEHRSNQRAEVILTQTPLSEDPYSTDNAGSPGSR